MLNCVIIDDEDFSVDALKRYIDLLPNLSIAGVYTDPQIALTDLVNTDPFDILFLDVDMPLISGIELARIFRNKVKKIIFTTSHSKYAFEAFEVEADAFLLKPFSFGKFSTTIAKLFPNIGSENSELKSEYFLVKNKQEDLRIVKVKYVEVVAFESLHNYIKIHLDTDKVLIAYLGLKDILDLVKHRRNFQQFHRAFIISTDYISYIEGNTIKMTNNLSIAIGERYKVHFTNFLANRLITTTRNKECKSNLE
ncbi:LytR/AlgR family response regulator transcription factor [Mucilaginibacter sp.]|uniref:LytR/AlgR family response regulator transcription factor n=1 Tax=Mucilaginibacter sp. TaxID=1882438 RepID=UPI000CB2A677|nr:LytTR family DNA-binding domain-containing protein [Mucilaginibacter sp.]PLW91556.1 MAG: DNA-binding response regulator [Mucilaginibacter sp.]HEK21862.1 response regulator transcription factor [Bacteroidota bacterium]